MFFKLHVVSNQQKNNFDHNSIRLEVFTSIDQFEDGYFIVMEGDVIIVT